MNPGHPAGQRLSFGQLGSSHGLFVVDSGDSRASSRNHGIAARWLLFEELGSSLAARCELLVDMAAAPRLPSTGLLLNSAAVVWRSSASFWPSPKKWVKRALLATQRGVYLL